MTPPREWLKPPRSLLLLLFLVTLVSVSALGWLGWKLLDQERLIESQRAQENLEQEADRVAALARGALAETGERVSNWLIEAPPEGKPAEGLLLVISAAPGNRDGDAARLIAYPPSGLLYRPFAVSESEDLTSPFGEAEGLEFQQDLPARAAEVYRRLAESKDPAIRTGALMRLARVLRKSGQATEARTAYQRVVNGGFDEPIFSGVPADLAARLALCELSRQPADARQLQQLLQQVKWPLTRSQFSYYWSEASRLGGPAELPEASLALTEAVGQWWKSSGHEGSDRGQTTVRVEDRAFVFVWRGSTNRRAVFITKPEALLRQIMSDQAFSIAALDSEGRLVGGNKKGSGHAAIRTPAETGLPWTLYLNSSPEGSAVGMWARQRFLLLVMGVMFLFLIAGAYFIAHAIRSDLAVARMQSDFVSAVSHEFRSPLTSIRQLSELLELGRVPAENRRQLYYQTLVRESTRLQRLVEALLNFGRMEAGVRQYRFERLDTYELVQRVAAEFEAQIAGSGRHVELDGPTRDCAIDADPEAISVALRNLVDNALKYAPSCPTVRVQWCVEKSKVAIRVCDRGPGVPASEHRMIFRKFVRGSTAEVANVKGSGVGLAMVRHIVAAHGGTVLLASEPGEGSVFTIELPRGAAMPEPTCENSKTAEGIES